MEQPAHDLRPFQTVQANPRRAVSLTAVALVHILAIYGLASGLASGLVQKMIQDVKVDIVKEKPPDVPKTPPPPPPELTKPPPPFVPPPDINLEQTQTAPTITQVTSTITPPPPAPTKPQAPAITAPASIGRAHECQSKYPPLAMRLNHEGSVLLGFTIEPDGSVSNAHVLQSSGHEELDQGAARCAESWHYKPAMQAGKPVAVPWQTKVTYKLTN